MDYNKLYEQIEEYVTALFENILHPHTEEISRHYNLSENEMLILFSAAWFHDCGHLFTEPEKHENMSCEIMNKFMKEYAEYESLITKIGECIMATKFPRDPKNLLEQIICDADTYHLGTREFKEMNKKMLEETKLKNGKLDTVNFNEETIKILIAHRFYTDYCKELLNQKKLKNLRKLLRK